MLLFLISVTVSIFLIGALLITMLSGKESIDARLAEISAPPPPITPDLMDAPTDGLAQAAATITSIFKPIRSVVSGSDEDMSYKLTLAGFRKAEHIEIFTATKMLLPVLAIVGATFCGQNMIAVILVGVVLGFMAPDMALSKLICMVAGLGIDQAMVRVGEEIRLTSPALADEFQIINREQRAGKPRLDAWRSMAARVDIDFVRQFVAMLIQTERFGTPIANALGQFSDTLRTRRTQVAEEAAAKAGVKLLFPLVFFIFPSIFVVALGPTIIGMHHLFSDMAN
jgi:tight adherence protein C